MIIDSHSHAWPRWPYQPPVPDDESHGRVEQLLFEMDQNGVDQAVIICAQIQRNPDNNEYIAEQVKRHPSRLHQFPDVDCSWSPTYHAPGAADRAPEGVLDDLNAIPRQTTPTGPRRARPAMYHRPRPAHARRRPPPRAEVTP